MGSLPAASLVVPVMMSHEANCVQDIWIWHTMFPRVIRITMLRVPLIVSKLRGSFLFAYLLQIICVSATGMFLGDTSKTFNSAISHCQSLGSDLLSIDSLETQNAAADLCGTIEHGDGSSGCWIGLYQPANGDWQWSDDTDIGYGFDSSGYATTSVYPWNYGEPNNQGANGEAEDCVQLPKHNMSIWNDVTCDTLNVPICKGTQPPTNAPTVSPSLTPSNAPLMAPSGSPTVAPSLSPTAAPTVTPTVAPSVNPTLSPTQAPTTLPTKEPTVPTLTPTFFPSIDPTITPSIPSLSPTSKPSQSPTQYPIILSDFEYSVTASFNITGWTSSEISDVSEDIELFSDSLTTYIHQGLDNDDQLEYRSVLPNTNILNDYPLNDLLVMGESQTTSILYECIDHGMAIQCHINCSSTLACIILADDSWNGMDRAEFEEFVSNKLNVHFMSMDTSTANNSGLVLVIKDITLNQQDDITTTALDPGSGQAEEGNDQVNSAFVGNVFYMIIIVSIAPITVLLCLCIVHRKYLRKSQLTIRNALVAMVSIGDYSDGDTMADKEVSGEFMNLPVEKDIENLKDLCAFMGWTFVSKGQKVHWTEKEIMFFIQTEIGEMLFTADGSLNYDGLIVAISGHGIMGNIVTSDFKAMDKTAIHRILSRKYPELREIPRIFVFDCCDGSNKRRVTNDEEKDRSKSIELIAPLEQSKNIALDDLQHLDLNRKYSWTTSTKNPDYNLVEIHAANSGYAAKMSYKGSYLVYLLAKAIKLSVTNLMTRGLAELLEEIQNALHDKGHQQTVNITNNRTRTLVFKKNKRK